MKTWTLLGLAALVMLAAGCGASRSQGTALSVADATAGRLTMHWNARVDLDEETGEKVAAVYYEPGRIYLVTTNNRVLGLDAFSGTYLWSTGLGNKDLAPSGITQLGRAAFICILDKLYALNGNDGRVVRVLDLKYPPTRTPVVTGDYVYYGTNTGWFMADGLLDLAMSWNRLMYDSIMAAPTCDDSRVYFADIGGTVMASSYNKRVIQWQRRFGGAVVADLKRTTSGLVLVACRDYTLYALNPVTGQTAWQNITGDPLEKTPHVRNGQVFVVKKGDVLLDVDEDNGLTVWKVPGIADFLAASEQTVFARTVDGKIAVLAAKDGSQEFVLDPDDLTLAAVNDLDGQLILASPDGRLINLREKGVRYVDPTAAPAAPAATPAP